MTGGDSGRRAQGLAGDSLGLARRNNRVMKAPTAMAMNIQNFLNTRTTPSFAKSPAVAATLLAIGAAIPQPATLSMLGSKWL